MPKGNLHDTHFRAVYKAWMVFPLFKLVSVTTRMLSKPILERLKRAHKINFTMTSDSFMNRMFERMGRFSYRMEMQLNSRIFLVEDPEMFDLKITKGGSLLNKVLSLCS